MTKSLHLPCLPCHGITQLRSNPMIAFKNLVSGDVGTNAWKVRKPLKGNVKAHSAVGSGKYTFWQEPNALDVGVQTTFANAAGFKAIQDCINACDEDRT